MSGKTWIIREDNNLHETLCDIKEILHAKLDKVTWAEGFDSNRCLTDELKAAVILKILE